MGLGTTSPTYRLQLGTNGSLKDSIRMGTYTVAKDTRQYIGYARADTGLFESSGDGDSPSTVKAGVAGIRIVNTTGTVASAQADNSVQLLTHIYNGNSRVALRANYDGKIGIGTVSPGYTVDVIGDIRATTNATIGGVVIHNTTSTRDKYRVYSSSEYAIGMQSGITFGGLSDWAMTFQFNNDNARGFWWGDNAHTTGQGAMSLTTNGYLTVANLIRVGYGESDTTDPTSTTRFDVAGSTGQLFSVVDSTTGTLMAVNDSSGMPILEVTSSDEVIVTGQILCTGEITAYYSDERLKNRLGRINNALDTILSLNGFKYTANELAIQNGYKDTGVQLGLSAQEVQKVLPELVKLAAFDVAHDDNGNEFSKTGANYLTLDYTKLVPVLIEAIKEQQQRIEKLEKIILEKNEG